MEKLSVNRKVKYTKAVIKQSLFELLETRPLQQVTVKKLCELADINRGTFYTHYSDIHDLIGQLEVELSEKSRQMLDFSDLQNLDWHDMFVDVFTHIKTNDADYKLIRLNPDSARCLDPFLGMIYQHYEALLIERSDLSDKMREYAFTYLVKGCEGLFAQWTQNRFQESPEEMASLMSKLTQYGVTPFIA
ncbi:MAG: TetR-like C-terminal domain-containing protein [Chloroflexota bacterium]